MTARVLTAPRTTQSTAPRLAAHRRTDIGRLAPGLVLVLTIASLVLRLSHIDFQSLWLDEGYTLLFSGLPLPRLITVGGAHEHPPLYYLLVHVLFGVRHSYLVPRYISVAAGTASIPLLYLVGSHLFDRAVGLIAAALLAVSPFHFWFSDDGRAYELAGFFVLWSYLLVILALEREHRPVRGVLLWSGYAVALTACLYTEYTTILVLIPQALFLLRAWQRGSMRPLLASWIGAAVAFAPWLPVWLHNAASVSGNYWIPNPTWASLRSVMLEALGLQGTCPRPPCIGSLSPLPGIAGHAAIIAAIGALLVAGTLVWGLLARDLPLSLAISWFVVPFALVLAIALRRSLYLDRVFLDATFGLYLVLAWAAVTAARHRVTAPLAALLVIPLAGGIFGVHAMYRQMTNPDWKTAIRDFQQSYRPGQAVVFYPGPVQPIATSYLPSGWRASRQAAIWFRQYLDVPGWQNRYPHQSDEELLASQLARVSVGEQSVWLLAEDYTELPEARHWFSVHGYSLRLSQMYSGDTRIELWQRTPIDQFGPAVVPARFGAAWKTTGAVARGRTTASVTGRTSLTRSFAVRPGGAYAVNVEYRCSLPAYPMVSVVTEDAQGHAQQDTNRFGTGEDVFPRSKWYDWPVTGLWISQPFGFVVPPGNVHAVLQLRTLWGACSWTDIAVYRER